MIQEVLELKTEA